MHNVVWYTNAHRLLFCLFLTLLIWGSRFCKQIFGHVKSNPLLVYDFKVNYSNTAVVLFQLQDVSKLKPLQDLTSLILIENPIVTLPHYSQFTIFHLRSLESLEGQPVTTQDRQEAFERFNLGKRYLKNKRKAKLE